MNAHEINTKLDESLESQIKVYPVRNLRASNLGHPCERYLYLLIKHSDEQKPHDKELQSIFNLGNTLEEHTIKNIKEAGFEIITPAYRSWQVDIKGGIISGREDVRIKDENGYLLPVEIKGISAFEWDKLNCIEDFLRSKKSYIRSYPAQLMVYCLHFSKEQGFFALTNKVTGKTKFIDVPFDYDYTESLLQKGERVYAALKSGIAPPPCEDISFCESCSMAHVCGECRRVMANIETDSELEELINRKQELAPIVSEAREIDYQIKQKVGEREKIITGNYLLERKRFEKQAYTVPASIQYRLNIKKL